MKPKTSKNRTGFLHTLGKALSIAVILPGLAGSARAQSQAHCYNGNDPAYYCPPPKPCDCEDGVTYDPAWGPNGLMCLVLSINPINAASSDVQRAVNDLEVFGGAGSHRLAWTRYGHSRLVSDTRAFGDGGRKEVKPRTQARKCSCHRRASYFAGCRLSVVGCRLPVAGCRLLVAVRFLVISIGGD